MNHKKLVVYKASKYCMCIIKQAQKNCNFYPNDVE